jgi:phosphomannomutase
LLTNAWYPHIRQAAETFGLDCEEMNERHNLSWWFNLRASNTEPVMRLTQELKKKDVLKIMAEADPSLMILLSFHNPKGSF